MKNIFENYIHSISSKFSHKETSEMGYRADFEILLKGIFEEINVRRVDHDPRAKYGNRPDFIVLTDVVPILYIETKDIGSDLNKTEKTEQLARYYGYDNLVLTDYVEFRFFRNGQRYEDPIKIAEYAIEIRDITPIPENYEHLAKSIVDFTKSHKEPIRSGKHLSKIMGGKAQRIRDNVKHYLSSESEKNASIIKVYNAIKKQLVHDLTKDAFADMYAQTLVYGLFVARYHDETPDNFTRLEARELIPKSNPLLRHFFDHIVGTDFDKRLEYIVNELCTVFSHADVQQLMKQYYEKNSHAELVSASKSISASPEKTSDVTLRPAQGDSGGPDPVIHFYEDFLKEYDPELRKKLGAFYTPLPVVRFIIRSVDYLLKKEFRLESGLADSSKLNNNLHRLQILDPAVGTGTFLNTVIQNIYAKFEESGQKGRWTKYVFHDLLPRIHGFELMMAPYTIAHLKLSMTLKEMGFKYFNEQRLGIYLTNSLEEGFKDEGLFGGLGFAESIADESKEASVIKNEMPIMVVIGNPPYFGESFNKKYEGHDVYKQEPLGGKLKEKNSKWLNDDYVKFVRLAESMIERNRDGIIGMITAHGWIDNPTFRGMRWHILNTFDILYILDLHGNSNKREKTPDGKPDKNVFNIKTGVSILLAVKRNKVDQKDKPLSKVYRADTWGEQKEKFAFLGQNTIESVKWQEIVPKANYYDFLERDEELLEIYKKSFSINEIFSLKNTGVVTKRDNLCIHETTQKLWEVINDFVSQPETQVRLKYKIPADVRDWKYEWAKQDLLQSGPSESNIIPINYRPFDSRFFYYTGRSRGFVGWPIERLTRHYIAGENIGLLVTKTHRDSEFRHVFVTRTISEVIFLSGITASNAINLPLYYYAEDGTRIPNLKKEIVDEIEKTVGKVTPENIFDYIYAVLHSPSYREKYKEFLKIDFPRVPYPKDKESFNKLVKLGTELRSLHLLESTKVNQFITTYPVSGSDTVEKIVYKDSRVYINKDQYFGYVPESAWNFYVGGYQPAQKWLKDRKGRSLTNNDIEHYQKIIVVLVETERIMKKIDENNLI